MKKQDFIVIGAVIAVAALLFAILFFGGKSGEYVNVEVNGKTVASFPLNEDTQYLIKTGKEDTNLLVISDGSALITEANCPDKICVHHRKISKSGESIICLPHKVVVSIVDNDGENDIDSVS